MKKAKVFKNETTFWKYCDKNGLEVHIFDSDTFFVLVGLNEKGNIKATFKANQ